MLLVLVLGYANFAKFKLDDVDGIGDFLRERGVVKAGKTGARSSTNTVCAVDVCLPGAANDGTTSNSSSTSFA